jgi:hypothetical protein
LCINTTLALAHNMKSKNVHNIPTLPQQQQKVCFLPLNSFFFIIVVREGKERK